MLDSNIINSLEVPRVDHLDLHVLIDTMIRTLYKKGCVKEGVFLFTTL